jgi:hypothetical protein
VTGYAFYTNYMLKKTLPLDEKSDLVKSRGIALKASEW